MNDRQVRIAGVVDAAARLAAARAEFARVRAGAWVADLNVARATLTQAKQERASAAIDLERLIVTAPRAGTVLKLNVRAGEYAQSGLLANQDNRT